MDVFDGLSDEDEDLFNYLQYTRRPYTMRPEVNYFNSLDEKDFFVRFRIQKETAQTVLALIEDEIKNPTDRLVP